MKPEEAIGVLELLRICDAPDLQESVDMAVVAIEKQIKKEPNEKYFYNFYKRGRCISCNANVDTTYAYCKKCGQAIDWTEE